MLGAITSRTGFFLSSFQKWREEILLEDAPPVVFADLGYGVLDGAMVEVAAYCDFRRRSGLASVRAFRPSVGGGDKESALRWAVRSVDRRRRARIAFELRPGGARCGDPDSPLAYWVSDGVSRIFHRRLPTFDDCDAGGRLGSGLRNSG